MLSLVAKTFKVLNSQASPWQIGWGVAFGLMAGLLPFGPLTLLILLIVCLFTVNLSTFILMWGISGGLMLIFGDNLEALTWEYARQPALLHTLASAEFLQVLHLHYTLVLGAFVLGLILLLPSAWLSTLLVNYYRQHLMTRVHKWKISQILKASKLARLYSELQ